MIMEGLETLVAQPHHAFLLTETAAAAHFNVLSFDTCLFKTSTAQSSSISPSSAAAASYLTTAQFGGAASTSTSSNSNSQTSLLHYTAAAASASHINNNNNSVLRARNQTATPTQGGSPGNVAAQPIASSAASISATVTGASSGRSSASHLSLLNTSQQSPVSAAEHGVAVEAKQLIEALPGDLNTPVTTSSDIPSFFGPSTVVEPPPITGKFPQSVSRVPTDLYTL